jgi:hypothetical protein
MVRFPSSAFSPKLGQSFMVGSMTWIINADDKGEIMEVVQENPVPIIPMPAAADLVLEPLLEIPGSSSSIVHRLAPCRLRKHIE